MIEALDKDVERSRSREVVRQPRGIRDLGRAVGRVVAHELLVHCLAPSYPQAEHGLMYDQLGHALLIAPSSRPWEFDHLWQAVENRAVLYYRIHSKTSRTSKQTSHFLAPKGAERSSVH